MWGDRFEDRETVQPVLDFLDRAGRLDGYLHRDVCTRNEFETYLDYWRRERGQRWPLIYLAFHGSPGRLQIGDDPYTLDALADSLGRARGTVAYLGACKTLSGPGGREAAQRFLKQTNAAAILGFERSPGRIEAAAFDLLLLSYLVDGYYKSTATACRTFKRVHAGLCERVGFIDVIG